MSHGSTYGSRLDLQTKNIVILECAVAAYSESCVGGQDTGTSLNIMYHFQTIIHDRRGDNETDRALSKALMTANVYHSIHF